MSTFRPRLCVALLLHDVVNDLRNLLGNTFVASATCLNTNIALDGIQPLIPQSVKFTLTTRLEDLFNALRRSQSFPDRRLFNHLLNLFFADFLDLMKNKSLNDIIFAA